jgi:hypothetical protein
MHQRRASGSLGVEIPDVMEKGKQKFNWKNQASHEESYVSKCQSLLNQDIKWHENQKLKLILHVKYSKSQPLRVNAEARSSVTTLIKSKGDVVTTINLVQAQIKELFLYLILSIGMSLYQEGYRMDCQQSHNAQHSLKTQVRWVKHNSFIHYTSHWTRKNKTVQFPKLEGLVLPVMTIF